MIGANNSILTYRYAKSGGKEQHNAAPTMRGVSVYIVREQLERATMIDQANAHLIFRMQSDEALNMVKGDKVVDQNAKEYIVHSVQSDYDEEIGQRTTCILRATE